MRTDLGIAAAMARFDTSVVGAALNTESATHSDSAASCYLSSTFRPNQPDTRGIPKLLLAPTTVQTPFTAAFDTTYTIANNCQFANANGEIVRYIIDRQCDATTAGSAPPTNATCNVVSTSTPARTDDDLHTGSETVPLYRSPSGSMDHATQLVTHKAVLRP